MARFPADEAASLADRFCSKDLIFKLTFASSNNARDRSITHHVDNRSSHVEQAINANNERDSFNWQSHLSQDERQCD